MTPSPHTWLELSTKAFHHNITVYRSIIGPHALLAPVIKANGYGHGLYEMATLCQKFSTIVNYICVTSLSEALEIRSYGCTIPLLVLSYIDQDPLLAIDTAIDLPVGDLTTAQQLNTLASATNNQFSVHIKIDTGLSRLGFLPHKALSAIQQITTYTNLKIQGLYTHFAQAEATDPHYTQQQQQLFLTLINDLQQLGISIPYIHASNSAATALLPSLHYNFFRIGAGVYGLWPSEHTKQETHKRFPQFSLKPIMQWKTRIIHLKQLPAQQTIGYARTYTTTQPTTIALLPVGYADGYSRRLSNKGVVLVTTQDGTSYHAPVIGRVCMNLITIDVTHISSVALDDIVTLLGYDEKITPKTIATHTESYNQREITTSISRHIPRFIIE